MIVSVHQPQYLPWLGYFDKIDRADAFVLLDTVQYKKNEWQNRNRIKTAQGPQWLTVPVLYRFPQLICEVGVNGRERWQHRHQQALATNYRKAPHWGHLEGLFEEIFSRSWETVSELNIHVVKRLAALLGIATPIHVASELGTFPEDPDERLIALTKHFGAGTYLAGGGGRDYMDLEKYERAGVEVLFQDYRHPRYSQLFGEFEPNMSVIDLIYNHAEKSLSILRGLS
jgi:hypothetical protein